MKAINLKALVFMYREKERQAARIREFREYYGDHNKYTINAIETYSMMKQEFNSITIPVNAAIQEAEGKATARTITAEDIARTLIRIEDSLNISKKAMDGIKVTADINSQKFPKAYKYTPESTHFKAEYKNGSWRLTDIYRAECKLSFHIHIEHTDGSKKALIDKLTDF